MYSNKYIILIIIGCGLVTWLSRVLPFIILKNFDLPKKMVEFLNFVPIVIMSAFWFSSLFVQELGEIPKINVENFVSSVPTVVSAVVTKNLLVIVIVGILSLATMRFFL